MISVVLFLKLIPSIAMILTIDGNFTIMLTAHNTIDIGDALMHKKLL